MKTISIVNLKGGVGKTVTTVNMAAILAGDHGNKVLVIDADPQANATRFFGLNGSECNTIAGIMTGECDYIPEYIYDTSIDNVHCVPSEISLIESDIASIRTGNGIKALSNFLDAVKDDNKVAEDFGETPFDFTLIDCPPSFTAASVAAIYASDEVIIPIKIDAFALDGMYELMKQIDSVRAIRPGIKIAGVLVTMWHNCPAVVQGEDFLRKSRLSVYQTHIRRSDKVDESTFARQSLDEYSRNCAATVDYHRFVKEYLGEVL
ncbi:MAG: hypothetical protein CVU91_13460 [Firmicutes bacterium HGW-Firmicutes-16]|nr:MAG: hypothetical protein CVU91_13460 [Firmicutes bacterium HGW-Firmicutes-16]